MKQTTKKLTALLLSAIMLLSLASCGGTIQNEEESPEINIESSMLELSAAETDVVENDLSTMLLQEMTKDDFLDKFKYTVLRLNIQEDSMLDWLSWNNFKEAGNGVGKFLSYNNELADCSFQISLDDNGKIKNIMCHISDSYRSETLRDKAFDFLGIILITSEPEATGTDEEFINAMLELSGESMTYKNVNFSIYYEEDETEDYAIYDMFIYPISEE